MESDPSASGAPVKPPPPRAPQRKVASGPAPDPYLSYFAAPQPAAHVPQSSWQTSAARPTSGGVSGAIPPSEGRGSSTGPSVLFSSEHQNDDEGLQRHDAQPQHDDSHRQSGQEKDYEAKLFEDRIAADVAAKQRRQEVIQEYARKQKELQQFQKQKEGLRQQPELRQEPHPQQQRSEERQLREGSGLQQQQEEAQRLLEQQRQEEQLWQQPQHDIPMQQNATAHRNDQESVAQRRAHESQTNTGAVKELSVGLTFRRTKKGKFFIFLDDNNEKVFLDDNNNLHYLKDGYDSEEEESETPQEKARRLRQEKKREAEEKKREEEAELKREEERLWQTEKTLENVVATTASKFQQVEELLNKQFEFLDQQYQQYQQFSNKQKQYCQHTQYLQELEQQYRPYQEQQSKGQKETAMLMRQIFQEMYSSPYPYGQWRDQFLSLERKFPDQNMLRSLCHALQQLDEKQQKQYCTAVLQQAEKDLEQCSYPSFQAGYDQLHQQQQQQQYQQLHQYWTQIAQLMKEEWSLLQDLSTLSPLFYQVLRQQQQQQTTPSAPPEEVRPPNGYVSPSPSPARHSLSMPLSNSQSITPGSVYPPPGGPLRQGIAQPPPQPGSRPQSQPSVMPYFQPQQGPRQGHGIVPYASSSMPPPTPMHQNVGHSMPPQPPTGTFSGRYDTQRRPLYSDSTGNYFRYNALRQKEYLQAEELRQLQLR